jgi:hypothetical protein
VCVGGGGGAPARTSAPHKYACAHRRAAASLPPPPPFTRAPQAYASLGVPAHRLLGAAAQALLAPGPPCPLDTLPPGALLDVLQVRSI